MNKPKTLEDFKACIDLPPVNPRNCATCERSKDGHSAGTEECHLCMWESQYKPKTGYWLPYAELNGKTVEWVCSSCRSMKSTTKNKTEYCPVCGTKMESEVNE